MTQQKRITLFYCFLIAAPTLLAAALFFITQPGGKLKDYVRMKFPLRQIAYQWNGYLQVQVLKHNTIGNIHMGRDGWLFYFSRDDGNANDDFWGISSEYTVQQRAAAVRQFIDKPYGLSSKYLFVVAPNKETIYPEYTSHLFLNYRNLNSRYSHLIPLKLQDVNQHILWLEPTLHQAKQHHPVYYATDTHWSNWGAYNAHLAILKSINAVLKTNIEPLPVNVTVVEKQGHNDIYKMFNGFENWIDFKDPETQTLSAPLQGACCQNPIFTDGTYQVFENANAQHTVWVVGDSFSEALKQYLAPYFRRTIFMHFATVKTEIPRALKEFGTPDLVIDERVERYIDELPTEL